MLLAREIYGAAGRARYRVTRRTRPSNCFGLLHQTSQLQMGLLNVAGGLSVQEMGESSRQSLPWRTQGCHT